MGYHRLVTALVFTLLTAGWSESREAKAAEPVYVEIVAEQDHDSPDPLAPFDIRFIVYANGHEIAGMVFVGQFVFSHGNIMGEIEEWPDGDAQLLYSSQSMATFDSRSWNSLYGQGNDPDTVLLGLTSFHEPWVGGGEVFRIRVHPTDTGSIVFDSLPWPLVPTYHKIEAYDAFGGNLEPLVVWNPTIHVPPQPGDVRLRVTTHTGTDTIFLGPPASIHVSMDAAGNELAGAAMVFRWSFTNGNLVGEILKESGQVVFGDAVLDAFESVSWNGFNGGPTDTSLVGLVDFDGEGFTADAVAWSVNFTPTDTGTILIHSGVDFTVPPLCCGSSANDSDAQDIPVNWIPVRIPVVPCPYNQMGDVNQDAVLTSSDLIQFINYLFKSGPDPLPDRSVGDANCSGGLTGADVIVLVNHIFKGGAPPCACIVRRI